MRQFFNPHDPRLQDFLRAHEPVDWDDAAEECGYHPSLGCQRAGEEYCELECPFRRAQERP